MATIEFGSLLFVPVLMDNAKAMDFDVNTHCTVENKLSEKRDIFKMNIKFFDDV